MKTQNFDSAIEDLTLTLSLLVRRLRANAPPELREFSWTQKAVISRLSREGGLTAAELARAEGVKPQSMATVINSLEQLGLVERRAHPTDGRQFHIHLTPKGVALRKSSRDARTTWLAQAIAQLDKQEQVTLFKAGEILKHLVEL
jgi:DNA-binding MarR family transcriptional regulator